MIKAGGWQHRHSYFFLFFRQITTIKIDIELAKYKSYATRCDMTGKQYG
jgi:hypothetical protein